MAACFFVPNVSFMNRSSSSLPPAFTTCSTDKGIKIRSHVTTRICMRVLATPDARKNVRSKRDRGVVGNGGSGTMPRFLLVRPNFLHSLGNGLHTIVEVQKLFCDELIFRISEEWLLIICAPISGTKGRLIKKGTAAGVLYQDRDNSSLIQCLPRIRRSHFQQQ